MARMITRSSVESVRLRVFISGTTQFATVDTNTNRTAITASSTLMSFPRRVRAVAFSKPSSCTTCCCCCCSSILEMRVWQASRASCSVTEETLSERAPMMKRTWFRLSLPVCLSLFRTTDRQSSPPYWLVLVSSSKFHSGVVPSSHSVALLSVHTCEAVQNNTFAKWYKSFYISRLVHCRVCDNATCIAPLAGSPWSQYNPADSVLLNFQRTPLADLGFPEALGSHGL